MAVVLLEEGLHQAMECWRHPRPVVAFSALINHVSWLAKIIPLGQPKSIQIFVGKFYGDPLAAAEVLQAAGEDDMASALTTANASKRIVAINRQAARKLSIRDN